MRRRNPEGFPWEFLPWLLTWLGAGVAAALAVLHAESAFLAGVYAYGCGVVAGYVEVFAAAFAGFDDELVPDGNFWNHVGKRVAQSGGVGICVGVARFVHDIWLR